MIGRRGLLLGLGASAGTAVGLGIAPVKASGLAFGTGINAQSEGLRPGSPDNQGTVLQAILKKAAKSDQPVFLPPGRYLISDVTLPDRVRLVGVPGATVLEYAGGGHFLYAEGAKHIELSGLTLDGALMPYKDYAGGALRIKETSHAVINNCRVSNSALDGIYFEQSQGRVTNSQIDAAIGYAGIFAVENKGLRIDGNVVEECANAGILIHRYTRGPDNTIVSNNRVRRISAVKGGTGQYGNGINLANADGVIVANNHVSDCAFSTIRAFSSSNIQIANNTCLRAGETSVYSEFAFQGAVITGNIVDGAETCGISIANLNEGGRLTVCANNLVRNISDGRPYEDNTHFGGMGISAEADIALTGNVIENTKNFGMTLGWGEYLRNVSASSNVIRNTNVGIAVSVVDGNGPVTLSGNTLANLSRAGIVGYRWRDAVSGDLARSGPGKYSHLTIANNSLNY